MPTLTIGRPASATARKPTHPKAMLITDSGRRLVLPYAPNEVEHSGLADTFDTLDRPGRKPLLTRTGEGLHVCSFDILLAHPDHQQPVEGLLATLCRIADSGERVTLSLSALEAGVSWKLTDVTLNTALRQHGTNAVTRATAALTFTEASDATVNVGPLTGGHKPSGGKGSKDSKGDKGTTRRYTVKAGDTLARIAGRFYDNPNLWPRIAKASGVRDPRKLKVGTRLTIPPA